MPQLLPPTPAVRDSFVRAMNDFVAEGRGTEHDESALARNISEYGQDWHSAEGFEKFINSLEREGDTSTPPPPNWVHSTTYWWIERTDYLGSIRIRHALTPGLLEEGGHIGYDIAPAFRLKGHGTAMLRAALPIASELGIDPVLVTCDIVGSRKIIEANGGVFEDERNGKLRFWIPTS